MNIPLYRGSGIKKIGQSYLNQKLCKLATNALRPYCV